MSELTIEQRLESQNRELATLLSVQQAITSRLDRQNVLQMIADGARRLTNSHGTAVYLVEGELLRLAVLSQSPDSPNPPDLRVGFTLPLKQSLGWIAFQSGKPLLLTDVRNDARLPVEIRQRVSIQSYLGVPLVAGSQRIGLLVAVDKIDGPLNMDDERILTLLATSAVIGLENTRLYEEAEKNAALAERNRLARDLHDAVTQTLFSASLIAEVLPQIWENDPPEGRRRLEQLRQSTRGALAEMRTLLLELRPAALAQAEIGELIKYLVNAFSGRTRIPVKIGLEGAGLLPEKIKICIYRITQEAFNNIARHSDAEQVTLSLKFSQDTVFLNIEDDGVGFLPEQIPAGHLGLQIMRERASEIGADLTILSKPGQGCKIIVEWNSCGKVKPI